MTFAGLPKFYREIYGDTYHVLCWATYRDLSGLPIMAFAGLPILVFAGLPIIDFCRAANHILRGYLFAVPYGATYITRPGLPITHLYKSAYYLLLLAHAGLPIITPCGSA